MCWPLSGSLAAGIDSNRHGRRCWPLDRCSYGWCGGWPQVRTLTGLAAGTDSRRHGLLDRCADDDSDNRPPGLQILHDATA